MSIESIKAKIVTELEKEEHSSGTHDDIANEAWRYALGWILDEINAEPTPPSDSLVCHLDGNALCVVGPDFINLQESEAVFIALTPGQLERIRRLRKD